MFYYHIRKLTSSHKKPTCISKEIIMTGERIMTLHPQGKKGVHILKIKYDVIKRFILKTIKEHHTISYQDLDIIANKELSNTFDGKVSWYIVSVKLDLEARNLIERIPKTSPHQLRLKSVS